MPDHASPPPEDPDKNPTPSYSGSIVNPVRLGTPPAPRPSRRRLPWLLVGVLSAAVVALGTLASNQATELQSLRAAHTPSAAPVATGGPASPTASAPQTPDAETIALMKSLPRRRADDVTARGALDAPVVMIVWSDYRCPFCARWAVQTYPELEPYVANGSLRIEARDLVLFGEESQLAAVAARAAGEQGRFWQFHDALFAAAPTSGHPKITKADVLRFARTAGVRDLTAFERSLTDPALGKAVDADTQQARQLGISSTPFFLINTTPINGAEPTQVFVETIEQSGGHR